MDPREVARQPKRGTPFCDVCGAAYDIEVGNYGYRGGFFCAHHAPEQVLSPDPEMELTTLLDP